MLRPPTLLVLGSVLGSVLIPVACASPDSAPADADAAARPTPADADASADETLPEDGDERDEPEPIKEAEDGGARFPGTFASPSIVRDGNVYHAYFQQSQSPIAASSSASPGELVFVRRSLCLRMRACTA